MKKSRKSSYTFSLSAYAAVAVSFLHTKETDSQVVYTDIDPDIILDEALESTGLDIDNNGTIDFALLNSSFTFFSESFSSYFTRQDILAGPYIPGNAIAGISEYFSSPYGGGFTLYYPFALSQGSIINNVLSWQNNGQQIMGIRTFVNYAMPNTWQCANCYWYGYFNPETIDRFLGIRFIGDFGENHYGWIRCDVKDEGRTLVIKDYAYETQPDNAILAGDTLHYVDIIQSENDIGATIYSFGFNIYVYLNDTKGMLLKIHDINGKELINKNLFEDNTIINMNGYATGFYILTLNYNHQTCAQMIMLY